MFVLASSRGASVVVFDGITDPKTLEAIALALGEDVCVEKLKVA